MSPSFQSIRAGVLRSGAARATEEIRQPERRDDSHDGPQSQGERGPEIGPSRPSAEAARSASATAVRNQRRPGRSARRGALSRGHFRARLPSRGEDLGLAVDLPEARHETQDAESGREDREQAEDPVEHPPETRARRDRGGQDPAERQDVREEAASRRVRRRGRARRSSGRHPAHRSRQVFSERDERAREDARSRASRPRRSRSRSTRRAPRASGARPRRPRGTSPARSGSSRRATRPT